MKKILISLAVIGVVAAIAIGGTIAYFSDTESNTGNTFSAGTIDIAIDGGSNSNGDWAEKYDIGDLKPGETGYINFRINNVGQNPVNISKTLTAIKGNGGVENYDCAYFEGNTSSEPECVEELEGREDDVQSQIIYDLSVEVYANDEATEPMWWQTIYSEDDEMSIAAVYGSEGGTPVDLGMIPVDGYMLVTQSYHFNYDAGNEYQGDGLTFGIEIKGEQLPGDDSMATVTLENKTKGENDEWAINQGDDYQGVLTYSTKGPEFVYDFTGTALEKDHGYVLAIGKKANGTGYDVDTEIATGPTDINGDITLTGSIDIGKDMTDVKVWLVPEENWTTGTGMEWGGTSPWPTCVPNFLWETALITYDDTDI